MKKVDNLGWVDGLSFSDYGTRVGVRVSDVEVLDRVETVVCQGGWALSDEPEVDFLLSLKHGGQTKRRGVRNFHLLYVGMKRAYRGENLEEALDELASQLEQIRLVFAKERVFVSAGLVEHKDRCLLLPGDEETGLPQLLSALEAEGATVLSESYATLDPEGRVGSYPLRDKGRRVDLVAFTEHSPKIKSFRPRKLSAGHASLHLMTRTLAARSRPADTMASLSKLCLNTRAVKGRRGEAGGAARALLKKL